MDKETNALPFDERLKLVATEIKARVAARPSKEQNHYRARLWVRWILKYLSELEASTTCSKQTTSPSIQL